MQKLCQLSKLPKHLVFVVAGPTASGKSQFAIDQVISHGGEIINADSVQLYKGLPILTAQPSAEDLKSAPHSLYDVLSFDDEVMSCAAWTKLATNRIDHLLLQNKRPWVVGGSGFYIKALIHGLSPIPSVSVQDKKTWNAEWGNKDISLLKQELTKCDSTSQLVDRQRILRAIMIQHLTGIPLSKWQQVKPIPSKYTFFPILIWPTLSELHQRLADRFDKMLKNGVCQEAIEFHKNASKQNVSALSPLFNAIGLSEVLDFCQGNISLNECHNRYVIKVRRYIKRQRTWFSHQFSPRLVIPHGIT